MNKAELVEELSSRFEGNRKQAQHALESVIDVIQRTMASGEIVRITGFGSFEKVERPARTARNPRTGARVDVAESSVPRFRPGADLKAVVSGAKKLPLAVVESAAAVGAVGSRAAGVAASAARAAGAAAGLTTSGDGPTPTSRRPTETPKQAAKRAGRGGKATADSSPTPTSPTKAAGKKKTGDAAPKTSSKRSSKKS